MHRLVLVAHDHQEIPEVQADLDSLESLVSQQAPRHPDHPLVQLVQFPQMLPMSRMVQKDQYLLAVLMVLVILPDPELLDFLENQIVLSDHQVLVDQVVRFHQDHLKDLQVPGDRLVQDHQ